MFSSFKLNCNFIYSMTKRSAPIKNTSRLAKRAKVTGLKSFYTVVPASGRHQPTSLPSPSSSDSAPTDHQLNDSGSSSRSPINEVLSLSESETSSSEDINLINELPTYLASPAQPLTEATRSSLSAAPYHPDVSIIPVKRTNAQNIKFQQKWFIEYRIG